jgi:hypothetical protein
MAQAPLKGKIYPSILFLSWNPDLRVGVEDRATNPAL